jgi:integrating conjugative element protein (TIGR03749 family)
MGRTGLRLCLIGVLLVNAAVATASTGIEERVEWNKTPIPFALEVGTERLVHFPGPVRVGVPSPLQGALRIQSVAGTVYLLAYQPFDSTRLVIRGVDDRRIYLLDLSADIASPNAGPLTIYLPDHQSGNGESSDSDAPEKPAYGYVTLTRFAAQHLYAPTRLLQSLPGVVQVPVQREAVALMRGDIVETQPLIAWRAGDRFVTAVQLTNTTRQAQVLDPRVLRGQWLAATFQHHRLHPAGTEADRTVLYLISARPFAASL